MDRAQSDNLYQFRYRILVSLTIAGLGLLSACAMNFDFSGTDLASLTPTATVPTASFTPSDPTATQVSLNLSTLTPRIEQEISSTPEPIPSTPDFSDPPDPQKSFTAWRPPVYPVPWIPSPQDHFYFNNPIAFQVILEPRFWRQEMEKSFTPVLGFTGEDMLCMMILMEMPL